MDETGPERARYRRILRFAAFYLAQSWWYELALPRLGLRRVTTRTRSARMTTIAKRFHVLAVDLGGLMIKVGQFMSSRLDILPPEITSELEGLQDEVPAVDFASIRALAEAELRMPLERAFASVEPVPIAAASLGQVHRAVLTEELAEDVGFSAVVLKVQRPGIETLVRVDLAALRKIAGWLSRVKLVAKYADMPAVIEEFAETSLQEIDYLNEAVNAERFAENFAERPRVGTPDVVWERTRRRVLTLSDVSAIKINDVLALRAAGIDPNEVANVFAQAMFEQLFTDGFFHADPHPGNIFVTPRPGGLADSAGPDWQLTFVDFGMMGEIPDALRLGLQEIILAVVARDGVRFIASIQRIGVLLPSADTADFERAMTELFDRFGGMGISELQQVDRGEMVNFAMRFGETMRSMPFQLPENFLLVIRAVSLVSGVCSALNPQFNMWAAVEPFSDSLLREQGGKTAWAFAKEAFSVAQRLARLPQRLDDVIGQLERGSIAIRSPELERRVARLERAQSRMVSAVLFAALLVAGVLVRASDPVFSLVLMIASALPLLHALFAGRFGRWRN